MLHSTLASGDFRMPATIALLPAMLFVMLVGSEDNRPTASLSQNFFAYSESFVTFAMLYILNLLFKTA